jgi:hypothetical protein
MPPRDPVLGTLYGYPKIGKTTDLAYAFPRALWLAAPGATAPCESVCGYKPTMSPIDIPDLSEATKILAAMSDPKNRAKIDVDAVIIDDLTLYVDRTVRAFAPHAVSRTGQSDGMKLWGLIRLALLNLRDTGRRAGVHVFMNAHEGPPRIMNGARVRGGPSLPGAGAELVPAACDVVLRAVPNPSIPIGWKVEYRCTVEDQDYVSGDRYNVTPDHCPMNIGEILRAQGFNIRRLADCPWQEAIVEKIATAILTDIGNADLVKRALTLAYEESIRQQGGPGMTPAESALRERRAVWTQRDAYDRAIIRNAQSKHRRRLFG